MRRFIMMVPVFCSIIPLNSIFRFVIFSRRWFCLRRAFFPSAELRTDLRKSACEIPCSLPLWTRCFETSCNNQGLWGFLHQSDCIRNKKCPIEEFPSISRKSLKRALVKSIKRASTCAHSILIFQINAWSSEQITVFKAPLIIPAHSPDDHLTPGISRCTRCRCLFLPQSNFAGTLLHSAIQWWRLTSKAIVAIEECGMVGMPNVESNASRG